MLHSLGTSDCYLVIAGEKVTTDLIMTTIQPYLSNGGQKKAYVGRGGDNI